MYQKKKLYYEVYVDTKRILMIKIMSIYRETRRQVYENY